MYRLVKNPYKGKFRWFVVKNLPGGKREYIESLGYISKADAELKLAEYNAGTKKEKLKENITLKDAYEDFTEYYETQIGTSGVAKNTYKLYSYNTSRILKHMGHIHLRDLSKKDIEKFKVTLKKEYSLSNTTVNKFLTELKKILEYMEDELEWFDCPKIKRMPISGTVNHTPVFHKNDLDTLIEGAKKYDVFLKKDLYIYLNLMKYTSMRAEEAPRIEWDKHVNLNEDWIHIDSDDLNKPGGFIPIVKPLKQILEEAYKNRVSNYVVPYRDSAAARRSIKRLIFYMREPVEKDLFCKIPGITEDESHEIWEILVEKKRLHKTGRISYIFSRLKDDLDLGLPIKYHHHRKDIIRLLRDYLGVVITPKMFRTSTATILSDEGVEMATVAALCRHKNIQTTHQSYIKKHVKGVKKAIEGKM